MCSDGHDPKLRGSTSLIGVFSNTSRHGGVTDVSGDGGCSEILTGPVFRSEVELATGSRRLIGLECGRRPAVAMNQPQVGAVGAHHDMEYSKGEVSSLVIKAYVVSLLLLLSVLVWSLGDVWVLFAHEAFTPMRFFSFFSSGSSH